MTFYNGMWLLAIGVMIAFGGVGYVFFELGRDIRADRLRRERKDSEL